jgi:citrate lyase subunit beta-like protein
MILSTPRTHKPLYFIYHHSYSSTRRAKNKSLLSSSLTHRLLSSSTTTTHEQQQQQPYRPRRSFLYMPGSSEKMMSKIPSLGADSICLDLEDAVAPNKKVESRSLIVNTLNHIDFKHSERLVRINPYDSQYATDDIHYILDRRHTKILPHGIVLPKVETADHIKWLDSKISELTDDQENRIKIIALIESAVGLLNLSAISQSSPRLVAYIFGADDYAADVGATRTASNKEIEYARNYILVYAKAHQMQAIDCVNINYKDMDALRNECQYGSQLGYTGKQLIHPNQISVAHEYFSPSKKHVEWSQRIVDADKQHGEAGVGAFSLDGQMIDAPTVKNAKRVVALAKACGLL